MALSHHVFLRFVIVVFPDYTHLLFFDRCGNHVNNEYQN